MNILQVMRVKNKRYGFTLAEAIVSLVIIAIGFLLMNWFLESSAHYQNGYYNEVHFYSYLNQFESSDYQLIRVDPSRLLLKDCRSRKEYQIRVRKKVLLLTGIGNRGYVPLINNVDSIRWDYRRHWLRTSILMEDKSNYQADSFVNKVR